MSHRTIRWVGPLGLVVLAFFMFFPRTAAAQGDSAGLLAQGKQAFLEGDYETSIQKFEEVMRLKPTSREALRLRERAGIEFLVEVRTRLVG